MISFRLFETSAVLGRQACLTGIDRALKGKYTPPKRRGLLDLGLLE